VSVLHRRVLHMSVLTLCAILVRNVAQYYTNMHTDVIRIRCVCIIDKQQACQLNCQVNAVLVQQLMMKMQTTKRETIALLLCMHACTICTGRT